MPGMNKSDIKDIMGSLRKWGELSALMADIDSEQFQEMWAYFEPNLSRRLECEMGKKQDLQDKLDICIAVLTGEKL